MPDSSIVTRPIMQGERYQLVDNPEVSSERVDALPVLLSYLDVIGMPRLLDESMLAASNGLGAGWAAAIWLTALLTQAEFRPDTLSIWVEQRRETLRRCTGQPVYAADLSPARLRELLRLLADDQRWALIEAGVSQRMAGSGLDASAFQLLADALTEAQQARTALLRRLAHTQQELTALNHRRRGKFTDLTALKQAAEALIAEGQLEGILRLHCDEQVLSRPVRRYRGRPGVVRTEREVRVTYEVDMAALAERSWRLGWWAYATTVPTQVLSVTRQLLAHRSAMLIERGSDQFGALFDLASPAAAHRDDASIGLVRLLTLGAQALALLDQTARTRLPEVSTPGELAGDMLALNTTPALAERLIASFNDLTLTIVKDARRTSYHLPPLNPQQQRILRLLDLPEDLYTRLAIGSNERAVGARAV